MFRVFQILVPEETICKSQEAVWCRDIPASFKPPTDPVRKTAAVCVSKGKRAQSIRPSRTPWPCCLAFYRTATRIQCLEIFLESLLVFELQINDAAQNTSPRKSHQDG